MATVAKTYDLVVYGCIRPKIESKMSSIPDEITQIFILFYPKRHQTFGIGSNDRCQLGLPEFTQSSPRRIDKMDCY